MKYYVKRDISDKIGDFVLISLIAEVVIIIAVILVCKFSISEDVRDVKEAQEYIIEQVSDVKAGIMECEPVITYIGDFEVTAYCACEECCGKSDGITASGTIATEGRTIAADPSVLPYGTEVYIRESDGLLHPYIVEDCGGAIKGNRIDVYYDSHDVAEQFGRQHLEVFIRQ